MQSVHFDSLSGGPLVKNVDTNQLLVVVRLKKNILKNDYFKENVLFNVCRGCSSLFATCMDGFVGF